MNPACLALSRLCDWPNNRITTDRVSGSFKRERFWSTSWVWGWMEST